MYLVLVSKCSRLSYLRFLITLSTRGLSDRCLPFVRVIPVTQVRLRPAMTQPGKGGCLGGEREPAVSHWNVDGELVPGDCQVHMRVVRGLVDVFARGVEVVAPR